MTMIRPSLDVVYGICRGLPSEVHTCWMRWFFHSFHQTFIPFFGPRKNHFNQYLNFFLTLIFEIEKPILIILQSLSVFIHYLYASIQGFVHFERLSCNICIFALFEHMYSYFFFPNPTFFLIRKNIFIVYRSN